MEQSILGADISRRSPGAIVTAAPAKKPPGDSILLVDYDQDTCECLGHILTASGRAVVICCDAIEAIEYYRLNHANIALVILDSIMPSMNGSDVLLAMKSANPALKAVVISELNTDEIAIDTLVGGEADIIRKPLAVSD